MVEAVGSFLAQHRPVFVMTVDKDRLFKKLEHVGEYVVRENLANGVYGPNRRGFVEEWLQQFEETDEPELVPEEEEAQEQKQEQEDETGALEAIEVASETPPMKWYQRLFGKGQDGPN